MAKDALDSIVGEEEMAAYFLSFAARHHCSEGLRVGRGARRVQRKCYALDHGR